MARKAFVREYFFDMNVVINLLRQRSIGFSNFLGKFGMVTTEKQQGKEKDENSSHGNTFIVL